MRKVYFITLFTVSIIINAQLPGGVKGADLWINATDSKDSNNFKESDKKLNFHTVFSVDQNNELENYKYQGDTKELTVFMVIQPAFQQEKRQVIGFETDNRGVSFLSNRIQSKDTLKIKNYSSDKPFILSYTESLKSEVDSTYLLSKIQREGNKEFEGQVAEIIFYPKFLSKLKRRKIETYLSLKYGISLMRGSDYINSIGDTIWKKDENRYFSERVTGIGVDLKGGFNNRQSSNVDDDRLLTIAYGKQIVESNEMKLEKVSDLNYLLWADNNGEVRFEKNESDSPVKLFNRTWFAKTIGSEEKSKSITLSFDSNRFEDNLNQFGNSENVEPNEDITEKYWLVTTSEEADKITTQNADFISAVDSNEEGEVIFSDIHLNSFEDSFLFSIAKAPELFGLLTYEEFDCQTNLKIKAVGGSAPYDIIVYTDNNQKIQPKNYSDNEFFFEGLKEGNYYYELTDGSNKIFKQDVYIEGQGINKFTVDAQYFVSNVKVELNTLSNSEITQAKWFLDDYEIHRGLNLDINKEGNYRVDYSDVNGCENSTSFYAHKVPDFDWTGIYPNPVKPNEEFFLKLEDSSSTDVIITISDQSGKVLKSELLKKDKTIYSNRFYKQGIYNITVETSNQKSHYTLIVK